VLDPTAQLGEDGTALGAGASVEAAEAALAAYKGEESPEGTAFVLLQAKMSKVSKTYVKLKWKKAKGAKSYVIYGNKCGKKNKYLKIKYVSGTSVKLKKVNGKKVKKGTYYKFVVVAVTGKKGTGNVVSTSVTVHAATKGGKVGNDKKVTLSKKKATLKKGKTLKLKAKVTPESKKLKVKRHRKTVWESSNPKVATVSKSGKVKAKKKGKAVIWAYAQDGVAAKCKVTVK